MKLNPEVIFAFVLALPINMVYGRIARSLYGMAGDNFQDTMRGFAETDGMPNHLVYVVMAWIPWGDLMPLITYAPAVVTAYVALNTIKSKMGTHG